jgi:hypothetical protein
MADPESVVQAATIARYRGDSTLQALMVGGSTPKWNIFDQGGRGEDDPVIFPCIFLHPITGQPGRALAFGTDAMDLYVQVSIFTQSKGFQQARAIAKQVYTLTHGRVASDFTLTGFSSLATLFDNRQEQEKTESGVLTQQIVDRYKWIIQG